MNDSPTVEQQRASRSAMFWWIVSWGSPIATLVLSWGLIDLVSAWRHKVAILVFAFLVSPVLRCIAGARTARAVSQQRWRLLILATAETCLLFATAVLLSFAGALEPAWALRWIIAAWCVIICMEVQTVSSITALIGLLQNDEFLPRCAPVSNGFVAAGTAIACGESLLWLPWIGPIIVSIGVLFTLLATGRANAALRHASRIAAS